jgi:hypothetical protein
VSAHISVPLHGRLVEVPRAALDDELRRSGAIRSLALVEAIALTAHDGSIDRDTAVRRLLDGLNGVREGTVALAAVLALVHLDARAAAPMLAHAAARMSAPLSVTTRVAALVLAEAHDELVAAIDGDDGLAQRAALVLGALGSTSAWLPLVIAAMLRALVRLQPTLGITAYRAMLGDLAEALFRTAQRGASLDALLGEGREALVDRLCAELPGTPDLLAARGMAWLLGALAPGDDAARAAIERARARFRDPSFHRDCAAMLGEASGTSWPPRPA